MKKKQFSFSSVIAAIKTFFFGGDRNGQSVVPKPKRVAPNTMENANRRFDPKDRRPPYDVPLLPPFWF